MAQSIQIGVSKNSPKSRNDANSSTIAQIVQTNLRYNRTVNINVKLHRVAQKLTQFLYAWTSSNI